MDNQITIQELYQIIGVKDVMIFKLEQKVVELQRQLENENKGVTARRFGNGEADTREALQPGI